MQHKYLKKEKEYLENFKATSIDLSSFHHKEHIQITYTLLIDNSINNTYLCIKNGILNILKSLDIDTSKYHETMTYAWILIVKSFMNNTQECNNFEEFISKNKMLLDTDILYKYYSTKLLQTEKARIQILNPDVENISIKEYI